MKLWNILTLIFAGCGLGAAQEMASSSPIPVGYHLVWADDFQHDPDGLPDPQKWGYEVGYVRNQENQFYTQERLENARVEKGQLIIEGRRESYLIPDSARANGAPKFAYFTSASLITQGKATWRYGRVEVRAKLPAGKGVWPAIWTLGSNITGVGWPQCGEIDIMELIGKEPDIIHGTLHFQLHDHASYYGTTVKILNTESQFHVYGAEWTPTTVDLMVDGNTYCHFKTDQAKDLGQNPFCQPHYLLLDLALGGSWGGRIDETIFPQRMIVDYVHIYQKSTPE